MNEEIIVDRRDVWVVNDISQLAVFIKVYTGFVGVRIVLF